MTFFVIGGWGDANDSTTERAEGAREDERVHGIRLARIRQRLSTPGGGAVTSPRRRYTIEQYRSDVAKLDSIRRSDAPGISEVLADALAADAEVAAAVEEVPTRSVMRPRRPNLIEATLRVVGLARRSFRPPR